MNNAIKVDKDLMAFVAHVSAVMEKITGVQLGKKQEAMVRSRLMKRAIDLKLSGLEEYQAYFEEYVEEEKRALVSLLTTHHTFFFREFQHFEYLERELLPAIISEVKARPDKTLRVWSAACSRGQEVYSLAMFLQVVLNRLAPDVKFKILGSDVDPESVKIAQNGVYIQNEIREAPLVYLGKHWAKGSGDISEYVKAKSSLKENCSFTTLNLFESFSSYPAEKFDIIFCRNVFIYFTPEQIFEIMKKLKNCLSPVGHIFLGVSESINGLDLKLQSVGPSVYRIPRAIQPVAQKKYEIEKVKAAAPQPRSCIRVFSIDDSSTIHTLLKKILLKNPGEFELVGSALNGLEASKLLDKSKVDLVTLDIHMPEVNGIEYLRKNFGKDHPPVVMISSVSREDSQLAFQSLDLGASDYVEKPALANLEERGEEIRAKLKAAYLAKFFGEQASKDLDKDLSKLAKINDPNEKAILVVGTMSQKNRWESFIKEMGQNSPPIYFFVEGGGAALDSFAKKISNSRIFKVWTPGETSLKAGEVAISDFKTCFANVAKDLGYKKVVINAFQGISRAAVDKILENHGSHLFVEDSGPGQNHPLKEAASDYTPATSFAYLSWKALAGE